jgi:hypothetical protein
MMPKETVCISGLWLRQEGSDAVVLIEVGGHFVEVIRERSDGPFSHIVEPAGMRNAISGKADEVAVSDLAAAGGIVDAT